MMRLSGSGVSTEQMLLAAQLDKLSMLLWSKTKDAQQGQNRPQSVLSALLSKGKNPDESAPRAESFSSEEEFEAARRSFWITSSDPDEEEV